ncbi:MULTISPECIES: tetratricopeptide repeat protein [unclassified Nitrospina]|uniref:tetratricopeptide repeat protein n=1 Tax=unclassified Nitrospina TaxID=2638683 RepID=UPI003F97580A
MPDTLTTPRLIGSFALAAVVFLTGCQSMPWNQKTEDELALEQEFEQDLGGTLEDSSAVNKKEDQLFPDSGSNESTLSQEEEDFFGKSAGTQEVSGQTPVESPQTETASNEGFGGFFGEETSQPQEDNLEDYLLEDKDEALGTEKTVVAQNPVTETPSNEGVNPGFDSIDQKTDIEEMKVDIQILQSQQEALIQRVKELQTVIQDMEPRLTATQERLETNLNMTAQQTMGLAPAIETLKQQIDALGTEIQSMKDAGPMTQAKLTPRKGPAIMKKATAYKIPQEYTQALNAYRSGQYDESIMMFQEYRLKNPPADLQDNIIFWLGNNYYQLGRFDEAISHFEIVLTQYPQGNKVHDSRFMMGVTLHKMGDTGRALDTLEKALQMNPPSEVRDKIERHLMEIK